MDFSYGEAAFKLVDFTQVNQNLFPETLRNCLLLVKIDCSLFVKNLKISRIARYEGRHRERRKKTQDWLLDPA